MFSPGDRYIHITKHGGINIGTVERIDIHHVIVHDKYVCEEPVLLSTHGVPYYLDGSDGKILKIEKEYTEREQQLYKETIEVLIEKKWKT
jgi:hypothetical protein